MSLFGKKEEPKEYMNGETTEVEERLMDALRMLRDAGIVSDDEYREKKARIREIN